jgi:hypothetical protein
MIVGIEGAEKVAVNKSEIAVHRGMREGKRIAPEKRHCGERGECQVGTHDRLGLCHNCHRSDFEEYEKLWLNEKLNMNHGRPKSD